MSVQATSFVIENSKHKGSALLCLIMIANHAHADGTNAFPSIHTLAKECRMSERQIARIITELEASGELKVERSAGKKPHAYAVKMTTNPDKLSRFNPDKMSSLGCSTLTSCHSNPDISRTAQELRIKETRAFSLTVIKERESARAKASPVQDADEQISIYAKYYPETVDGLSIFQCELLGTMQNLADCEAAIKYAAGNGFHGRSIDKIVNQVYANREWMRKAKPVSNGVSPSGMVY